MSNSSPSSKQRVELPHSHRQLPPGSSILGAVDSSEPVSVSMILKRKEPLDLKALDGQQMTREEYLAKHAAAPGDIELIRKFAGDHGLIFDEADSSFARRTVVLKGTAENMQKAFGVQLQSAQTEDGVRFRAREGTLSVPAEIAAIVTAVLGLDDRPQAVPHFRYRQPRFASHATAAASAAAASGSFDPPQVAQLYNFPKGVDGSGQTIGILELGGGFKPEDIQAYFQGLSLTPPTVTAVLVDGGTNAPTTANSADGEVLLDIEVAGAVAPGAKIAVYFAPNTDKGFQDALTTAIHDTVNTPSSISISWGGPESSWSQQAMTAFDDSCQSAAALGITITAASGDNGSADGVTDGADHTDFPASSPHVLACGGTALTGSGSSISGEVVWDDLASGGGATGGGVSTIFALPSWQQPANVPAATTAAGGRGVPDVSGNASPGTGYNVLIDGTRTVVGGTSAVAPLWAGLVALMNQNLGKQVGFLNPVIYPLSGTSAFRDITSGSNGSFSAGPGWDACTGLGSPNGSALLAGLGGTSASGSGPGSGPGGSGAGSGGDGGASGGDPGPPVKKPKRPKRPKRPKKPTKPNPSPAS